MNIIVNIVLIITICKPRNEGNPVNVLPASTCAALYLQALSCARCKPAAAAAENHLLWFEGAGLP